MYGKHITLTNGDQEVTIFVVGVPDWPNCKWEERAKEILSVMRIKK